MKIALCFRGFTKCLEQSISYWRKFVEVNNCDIFIVTHQTMSEQEVRNQFADIQDRIKLVRFLTDEEEQEIKDHVAKLINLDGEESLKQETILKRGYPQYYQLLKMVEELEPIKDEYDYFYVNRTDVLAVNKMMDQPNKTIVKCDHLNKLDNCPLCSKNYSVPNLSHLETMPENAGYSYSDFSIFCDWQSLKNMSQLADNYFRWRPNDLDRELYFYTSPEAQYRLQRIMTTNIIDYRDFANDIIYFKIFSPNKIQIIDRGKNYKLFAEDCFAKIVRDRENMIDKYYIKNCSS